jgi:hypothetical protein
MSALYFEKRTATRQRSTGSVLWRGWGEQEYGIGCLLEESDDGLAFAWRGQNIPRNRRIIEVIRNAAAEARGPERAVVRRVVVAHDDLVIVGAQLLGNRPFPPQLAAQAEFMFKMDFTPDELQAIQASTAA